VEQQQLTSKLHAVGAEKGKVEEEVVRQQSDCTALRSAENQALMLMEDCLKNLQAAQNSFDEVCFQS
jgi:hypothetical protein